MNLENGNYFLDQRITKEIQATVASVHEWLLRANFYATRKFFLGIIHRVNSLELLRKIICVLSTMKQKDFTYSRSQCNSSLLHEQKEFPSNKHEMTAKKIESQISKVWEWFSSISNLDKASFVFYIAMIINNSSILHQAQNLAKTIYVQLKREMQAENLSVESDDLSLPSTTYTFNTDEHPHLYLLAALHSEYRTSPKEISDRLAAQMEADYNDEFHEESTTSRSCSSSSSSSLDPRFFVVAKSKQAQSGVAPFADYISKLPVHLSKKIIGLLDARSQCCAAQVCTMWHDTVRQVQLELRTKREIREEAVMMQGVSAKGAHPNYAQNKTVTVPIYSSRTEMKSLASDMMHLEQTGNNESDYSTIPGLATAEFQMEERNVYCGSYNVLILDKKVDKHRVVHYSGGSTVASGSNDRTIRLFDINSGREIFPSIRGHPGSITSVFIDNEEKTYIFSGSYDTTIRRWHLGSSSCHQIMHGHQKSITTLDYYKGTLVSGSKDGLIKVWNIKSGKCVCTFRHAKCSHVTAVKIQEDTIVSSCDRGVIKVWNLTERQLIKRLIGHASAVVGVSMDEHYIVSASHDEYVLAWVKNGNISQPIKSYRHPKKVLCVELRYLRIISGCEDGKIRVLHLHTGECLRVVRGNSKCDPIVSICATNNRLIVNTVSNVLLLQFEPVELKYDLKYDQVSDNDLKKEDLVSKSATRLAFPNPYVRACRNRAASITCSNIRHRPISAPIRKQTSAISIKRPLSSFPTFPSCHNFLTNAKRDPQRSISNYSMNSKQYLCQNHNAKSRFNVHDSTAMSVVSGISSMILQEDLKLDNKLSRKSSACSRRQRNCPQTLSIGKESMLSRDRLHLRIGSIYHNIRNKPDDINTALNGGHPDIRELYHDYLQKNTKHA